MNNLLLPLSAYLILTENCNLRCKYCFERNSRTFSVMETVAYMQLPIKVSSKIIS